MASGYKFYHFMKSHYNNIKGCEGDKNKQKMDERHHYAVVVRAFGL